MVTGAFAVVEQRLEYRHCDVVLIVRIVRVDGYEQRFARLRIQPLACR